MADFVAAGLAGPGAIAVDFAAHFFRVGAVIGDEPLVGFFAGPAFGVQARIDHEAARTEGEGLQIAQTPDREIIIDAELVGDLLRVQGPAFGIGIERQQRADQRLFERVFALPDMAGNGFMIGEVFEVEFVVQGRGAEIDPCLLYTSPSPRDRQKSRMPSSA